MTGSLSFIDVLYARCYIFGMAEEKKEEKTKKELRKVTVEFNTERGTFTDVYRIIVDKDTTVDKEMEWRLEFAKDLIPWKITEDKLLKEIKNG